MNKLNLMFEVLRPAKDKNGHPITQNMFNAIERSLREIVNQYESMPDGKMGRGLTNGHYINARKALNLLDDYEGITIEFNCIHPNCECLDYCEALDPYSKTPIENPDRGRGSGD